MTNFPCVVAVLAVLGSGVPAFAQQYRFERSFDTGAAVTVDAETIRGKITVTTAPANRVVVRGTVTVRLAIDAPADAAERAKRLAANPPVQGDGDRVQLRPPSDASDRRAVTIAYDITVPPGASVTAISDSGALAIAGVGGHVTARTQSSALALSSLDGPADITTGSGAVDVDGAGGPLTVTTSSSAITLRGVRSDLRVKTGSGAVSVESRGPGDLEVRTSSSAVTLEGAARGVRVRSGSGHIRVAGRPGAAWSLANSSGGVDVTLGSGAAATIDASTRSGSIHVTNLQVSGTQERQRVQGAIGAGGPTVEITNSSGTIDLRGR